MVGNLKVGVRPNKLDQQILDLEKLMILNLISILLMKVIMRKILF